MLKLDRRNVSETMLMLLIMREMPRTPVPVTFPWFLEIRDSGSWNGFGVDGKSLTVPLSCPLWL